MNQNNILHTLVKRCASITLLLSAIVACDVNDLEPINAVPEGTAFSTPDNIELSIAGMYDAAQSGFYDPLNGTALAVRGYPFGAASIQQADNRGEDVLNVAAFYAFTYEGTYNATTPNNVNMWSTLYALINIANNVVEGVQAAGENTVISNEEALAYEGEARFMRALAYHELLIHFARPYNHTADASHPGVPYRDFAINSPETIDRASTQGRNTVAECYTRILEDLDFAEANLPDTRAGTLKITRATKGAAIALKTRVRLHQNAWSEVIGEANKLISATAPFTSTIGGYALTPSPETPFASFSNNSESIFSIENNAADNPGVNGSLPQMYASITGGRGLIAISPIIYNAPFWLGTDLRRTLLTRNNGRAWFTTKYRDVANQSDFAPIIRYAEVLLNAAEATARVAGSVDERALTLLNAVRNRSVIEATNQYTASSFANGNELIQAILNERRIEFLAEGRRFPDIHRLALDPVFTTNGVPAKVFYGSTTFDSWNYQNPPNVPTIVPAIPYEDYRFIWPIPAIEIVNNPVLAEQQNPEW